jgi:hypothetical protein
MILAETDPATPENHPIQEDQEIVEIRADAVDKVVAVATRVTKATLETARAMTAKGLKIVVETKVAVEGKAKWMRILSSVT